MDGNKPDVDFGSAFTRNVAEQDCVAYYPYPSSLCPVLVMFVVDEILVARHIADVIGEQLSGLGAEDTGTTVFEGLMHPEHPDDVEIWRLPEHSGNLDYPDVAAVVWQIREHLSDEDAAKVAPNHVVVPAPDFHTCPWGPPKPQEEALEFEFVPGDAKFQVAVVDAGLQQASPIWPRLESSQYGDWFTRNDTTGQYEWRAESVYAPGGSSDPLDLDGDGRLDALAGHANFVAGLIARDSPAEIHVWSHNSVLVRDDTTCPPIPTEASVARSLWQSMNCAVINVGFAFPTLPYIPLIGGEGGRDAPASWTLSVVVRRVDPSHVVVAPAGNQGCQTPQYPAAFSRQYDNVAAVGSLGALGAKSDFSNYGDWVNYYVRGEDLMSTFITWGPGKTEEREPDGSDPDKNFSGWARWNGTSFAAPQVTAAIVHEMADRGTGTTARDAWQVLKQQYGRTLRRGQSRP
jgi:subtilase family protein